MPTATNLNHPARAVIVKKGRRHEVHVLDAQGGLIVKMGGARAERAAGAWVYLIVVEAGEWHGRPHEGFVCIDGALWSDLVKLQAKSRSWEARRERVKAKGWVNPNGRLVYNVVLTVKGQVEV